MAARSQRQRYDVQWAMTDLMERSYVLGEASTQLPRRPLLPSPAADPCRYVRVEPSRKPTRFSVNSSSPAWTASSRC
ncbi:hypothetical protein LY15_000561 [Prauserella flava]|nr:hypothetical protein [Prauserella flava]MCR3733170.1 hypothetical protein [Prauserella salsuginis]